MRTSTTKNYDLFNYSKHNRKVEESSHRALKLSMKKNGFHAFKPIICYRDKRTKKLIVLDGQHRLYFAQMLGLPVHYTVVDEKFDVAELNSTAVTWKPKNYAEMYAGLGKSPYIKGLEFAREYKLPVAKAFTLLSGNLHWGPSKLRFEKGKFEIEDYNFASNVATVYTALTGMNKQMKTTRLLDACMAVARVPEFEPDRLLKGARRRPEKLVAYSTREAFVDMIEDIYNFGKHKLVPLKIESQRIARARKANIK